MRSSAVRIFCTLADAACRDWLTDQADEFPLRYFQRSYFIRSPGSRVPSEPLASHRAGFILYMYSEECFYFYTTQHEVKHKVCREKLGS